MKILEQLTQKGLLDEFISEFCTTSALGPQVISDRLPDAKKWLESHSITFESKGSIERTPRLIAESDFRIDQWMRVVNNKLDYLETAYDKAIEQGVSLNNSFFNYDISVLYTLDKKRLDAYPITVARVRAFAEKIGAQPYRLLNGDINTRIAYEEEYYAAYVKEPYKAIMGNPDYYKETIDAANECYGRP
ncbi:hypothetical protein [Pseudomonas phage PA1C]|nr:hypothetical protein [Pseudomonas phage PA1C]